MSKNDVRIAGTSPRKRADAQRNDQTLLDAAAAVFVASGVEAPVREIAARAAGEIHPGLEALELLRGVGNLCIGVGGDSRYDARRMVGLLIAGLSQSHPTNP